MNDGADAGDGHIVGVIHEMFIVDGNDWYCKRDGGAHPLFQGTADNKTKTDGSPHREILVAGGKDLQERKRLLVKDANGLIVLPGGPGTWDEVSIVSEARDAPRPPHSFCVDINNHCCYNIVVSCGKWLVSATWA
jgi:predicted Rossmann-fold nucleotide-binding protein